VIKHGTKRDRGCLEPDVAVNVAVELLFAVGESVDAEALRNEEIGLDSVSVVSDLGINRVIELQLELIAVVNLNATVDEVFMVVDRDLTSSASLSQPEISRIGLTDHAGVCALRGLFVGQPHP